MDIYQQWFIHLDELRKEYNIKIENFCEDICSDRQYRRYLNGENIISQGKFALFLEKLVITQDEFYNSYYKSDKKEYAKIVQLYKLVMSRDYDNAEALAKQIGNKKFREEDSQRFLNFCLIVLDFSLNKITQYETVDKLSKLINYPGNMNKNTFTFIEMVTLYRICIIESKYSKFDTVEKLFEVMKKKNFYYVSSSDRYILPSIYSGLAIMFSRKKDFTKSKDIALEGIEYSLKIDDSQSLINLYYIMSYTTHLTGDVNLAYEYAKKCIATCISKDNDKAFKKYNEMFLKEQGYSLDITRTQ